MITPEKTNCEVCGKEGLIPQDITIHATMPFCRECLQKELAAEAEIKATANDRVAEIKEINIKKEADAMLASIDTTISIKTDIFNAELPSIMELKTKIDGDPTIENKLFELARVVVEQFNHLKKVIFDISEAREVAVSKQRALHSYLNTLSNKLREEERETLKLRDINYRPETPKATKPQPKKKISTTKIDKEALRKAAAEIAELGVGEAAITTLCYAKGLTIEQAVARIREVLSKKE